MNFNTCRHFRLAGAVAVFVGFYLHNWAVVLLGNVVMLIGYMLSVSKIERYIEDIEALAPKPEDRLDD